MFLGGSIWLWVASTVLVLIGYAIYCAVKSALEKRVALKDPTSSTPLPEFKESYATDRLLISTAIKTIENISERFERMCILDPITYKDDPTISAVVDQYKKLLRGEIKDPEGRHMPSEILNGKRNLDYDTYIAAQKKVMGNAGRRECLRLKRIDQEESIRADFVIKLVEMDFPVEVLDAVLSDEKLNAYSAADWKNLTKAVKGYLDDNSAEAVSEFLCQFNEIAILCDSEKMEIFSVFYKHAAPMPIITEFVRGRISLDQGVRITQLVMQEKYDWDEATEEVLEEDLERATEADLKKKYRKMLTT